MPQKTPTPYSFGPGYVQDATTIRVISQLDQLLDAGEIASNIMKWMATTRSWNSFSIEWSAVRLCLVTRPQSELCILGPDGDVFVVTTAGHTEETLDESMRGPSGRGPLRDLRWIGNHLYAVGMSRQVYNRQGSGLWRHRDDGTVLPLGSKTVAGFNSIDGISEDDFYAVVFGGEIWRCLKGRWHQIESPTNVVLHRVKVVRNDLAYACGQQGVILRGTGDNWEQISHDVTKGDLWDAEWYGDRLYLAKDDGLFTLTESADTAIIKLGSRSAITCRHLHANDGILLSSGPKNILLTSDGKKWQEITP
jgi:hypothetical protein